MDNFDIDKFKKDIDELEEKDLQKPVASVGAAPAQEKISSTTPPEKIMEEPLEKPIDVPLNRPAPMPAEAPMQKPNILPVTPIAPTPPIDDDKPLYGREPFTDNQASKPRSRFPFAVLSLVAIALLAGNVFLGIKYFAYQEQLALKDNDILTKQQQLNLANTALNVCKVNTDIISLQKLFIDKVLSTKGEVSVEDRLLLEKAVVDLKDNDIINAWNIFTASATEQEAQASVLVLLKLFAGKIIY